MRDAYPSDNIEYGVPFSHNRLDVWLPVNGKKGADTSPPRASAHARPVQRGAPVIVVVPSPIVPVQVTTRPKAYIQLAQTLRAMGLCVVIPEISQYPGNKVRQSVIDLRLALSWVGAHIASYGGDPSRIYVMGHGLSGHLVLLTLVQEATVMSCNLQLRASVTSGHDDKARTDSFAHERRQRRRSSSASSADMQGGNLLRDAVIYAPQIRLPQIAGVVLLAGVSDVIKKFHEETMAGIEHLSALRRATGPSQAQCTTHSPTHLLIDARKILDTSFLPKKYLLIHGGQDNVVSLTHSTLLRTVLSDEGVERIEMRAYRDMSHMEALTCLFKHPSQSPSRYSKQVLTDLQAFVS